MSGESFRVLVPVRMLDDALPRMDLPAAVRRDLALAFARDTVAAAARCSLVAGVAVVTSDAEVAAGLRGPSVEVLPARASASVASVVTAAHESLGRHSVPVAVLMGDLPALLPEELFSALSRISNWHRTAYASELVGDGTTLFASRPGAFRPCLGPRSAAWNESAGSLRVGTTLPGLRCDVDDLAGLAMAKYLGVGGHTRRVLDGHPRLRALRLAG